MAEDAQLASMIRSRDAAKALYDELLEGGVTRVEFSDEPLRTSTDLVRMKDAREEYEYWRDRIWMRQQALKRKAIVERDNRGLEMV